MSAFAPAEFEPTPAQLRVAAELFDRSGPRPEFGPRLGEDLRDMLESGIGPMVADRQLDNPLFISKRILANVHTCEGMVQAEHLAGFTWSAPVARGTVAHKAVELSVSSREPVAPLDLVDQAIERLAESGGGISDWLSDAPAAELAELRGAASDWIVKFQDTFPVLQRDWRPRVESPWTVDLCGGRVRLRGRVDLALGRAVGTTARVLVVDFKTGRVLPVHTEDLRFYALLETIRVGVPPFRLATFSLDSGTWVAEDVDEDVLVSAARRVLDGTTKLIGLEEGRVPVLRAGPACGWCPAAAGCEAAIRAGREDRDGGDGADL